VPPEEDRAADRDSMRRKILTGIARRAVRLQ